MAETSFDAVAGSLNSNIPEFKVLTGTTATGDQQTQIPYPSGYDMNNTYALRAEWYMSSEWHGFNDSGNWIVHLTSTNIRLTSGSNGKGIPYRIVLMHI